MSGSEGDARRLGLARIGVDGASRDAATRPLAHQPRRPIGTETGEPMLLALLEAQAGLGPQRVAEGGPADADRVEDRGFDDDGGRRVAHLGCRAAHDARERQRTGPIGDQQRRRVEVALDVVERLEALARTCPPDDQPRAAVGGRDRAAIERVDRLAELEHDVVRGVDDVAHRPQPGGQQAHLDSVGRRADRDVRDPAADEPRAQRGVGDIDGQAGLDRVAVLDHVGRREADLATRDRGHLARQPDERQRVAAVRLDVDVEHPVAVQVGQVRPDRRLGRQDEDPVAVRGHAKLLARAEHPIADHAHLLGPADRSAAGQHRPGQCDRHALADLDVRGAAHDLERFAVSDRDPGQRQPICARVGGDLAQLADDHGPPVGAPALEALDLHAEHGEPLGERRGLEIDVDVVPEPGQRHPQRNCSRKRRSSSR